MIKRTLSALGMLLGVFAFATAPIVVASSGSSVHYDSSGSGGGFANPATTSLDMDSQDIITDADGNSRLELGTNDVIAFHLAGGATATTSISSGRLDIRPTGPGTGNYYLTVGTSGTAVFGVKSTVPSVEVTSGNELGWSSATRLAGSTDGTLTFKNSAGTNSVNLVAGASNLLTTNGAIKSGSYFDANNTAFVGTSVSLANNVPLNWSSTAAYSGSKDIGLARNSAGVLGVTDGSTGAGKLQFGTGPTISSGTGTPEGAVTASVGSIFLRTDGGASTTLYVKESGAGNTGWVGK